jgi:hypothetical protein
MIDRYVVSMPTWLGAYEKGIREGMTDEEASAYGDKAVRQSQGSGREKDLSAFQSPNNDAMRFFSMFYTPWNVLFNQQWKGARGLRKGDIKPMISTTFWWMIVSVLGDALMSGDWPDFADEESMMKWYARNVFFGMFSGIPIIRDFASVAERKLAGQYADIGSMPTQRIYSSMERAAKDGYKLAAEGEAPGRPLKETGDLAAVFTGLPLSQPATTGQFLWDYAEGEADPQSISDWYFGITKGKVPDKEE